MKGKVSRRKKAVEVKYVFPCAFMLIGELCILVYVYVYVWVYTHIDRQVGRHA